jgi:glycosyltransferase involved in cell wall biosynthesis
VIECLRARGHEVALAVGVVERGVEPPCPVHVVEGLDARERRAADVDRVSRAQRPDLVHLHTVMNPAVLEWAAGRPALLTVQDHRYFCPGRGKWTAAGQVCRDAMGPGACAACFDDPAYFDDVYALTAERLGAARALPLVVLSQYMRGELIAAGVPADRVTVVPPFVHALDETAVPNGPPCVLFAGRLVAGKGVREAVEAWRASGVALPLVFAGTGPLREELVRAGFEVLGWQPHHALAALYRRARAVVLPSRWQEPFGIVGLESLAMGTPVAAWRSGGVEEWHPGGETLAEWGDVAGLARAIRAAADGPRARPAPGFEPGGLMRRLLARYERTVRGEVEHRQHDA